MNKTRIVKQLSGVFPVCLLLTSVGLKATSYYYCSQVLKRPDKHIELRSQIQQICADSGNTYGSLRVWTALRRESIRVSEKVVRRIMKEEQIPVYYAKRKRKYSSYEGETYPAPADLVQRKFSADSPNQLWLTDVTEFAAACRRRNADITDDSVRRRCAGEAHREGR